MKLQRHFGVHADAEVIVEDLKRWLGHRGRLIQALLHEWKLKNCGPIEAKVNNEIWNVYS